MVGKGNYSMPMVGKRGFKGNGESVRRYESLMKRAVVEGKRVMEGRASREM